MFMDQAAVKPKKTRKRRRGHEKSTSMAVSEDSASEASFLPEYYRNQTDYYQYMDDDRLDPIVTAPNVTYSDAQLFADPTPAPANNASNHNLASMYDLPDESSQCDKVSSANVGGSKLQNDAQLASVELPWSVKEEDSDRFSGWQGIAEFMEVRGKDLKRRSEMLTLRRPLHRLPEARGKVLKPLSFPKSHP